MNGIEQSVGVDLSNHKHRDRLSIVAEILEIAMDGSLKTQIMYAGNLSFAQLNEYLEFLLKTRLLEKGCRDNKSVYRATQKGKTFLHNYYEVVKLLQNEEEEENSIFLRSTHLNHNRLSYRNRRKV